MDPVEPPFQEVYEALVANSCSTKATTIPSLMENGESESLLEAEIYCELPLIDLSRLSLGESESEECKAEIVEACKEWGFFQVVNHGVSGEALRRMRDEQAQLFNEPFRVKRDDRSLNFPPGSYRWGSPSVACQRQLTLSEAFHVSLADILAANSTLSSTMKELATSFSVLAQMLAEILADNVGLHGSASTFKKIGSPKTCYLRLNRYPPCSNFDPSAAATQVIGLVEHTDSDFLTVLHQDHVGGLQILRNGIWVAVRPIANALIINIGDLFQAWSNDLYKSAQHRVVLSPQSERFSIGYFLCPPSDAVIQSSLRPSVYRSFTFGEYRQQVEDDVQNIGCKIGISRFLV